MRLVDTEVAACAVGVTPRTIRRWVQRDRLTNHGDWRHILVDLDALDALVYAVQGDVR